MDLDGDGKRDVISGDWPGNVNLFRGTDQGFAPGERLKDAIQESSSSRAATTAMANLAEAIQGLVHHMRTEQQMIRDWVDSQAQQHRDVRRLLEILVREDVNK